jgi:hypothetical protein
MVHFKEQSIHNWRFRRLTMQPPCYPETLGTNHPATRRQIPEGDDKYLCLALLRSAQVVDNVDMNSFTMSIGLLCCTAQAYREP